ncbi:TPA: hypothetical protein N0F65_011705, partial [Lagenidium giganteum]
LLRLLPSPAPLQAPPISLSATLDHTWVLGFDGGSQGKPGVAGCGSILRQYHNLTGAHEPKWISAHFMGTDNTNNQAEYQALLIGLQSARRLRARPLHIVGDSLMIIRQHRTNHGPINKLLVGLF